MQRLWRVKLKIAGNRCSESTNGLTMASVSGFGISAVQFARLDRTKFVAWCRWHSNGVRGTRAGAREGVRAIGNHWLEEVAMLAPEEEAAGDAIVESGAVVEAVDDAVRLWVVTGLGRKLLLLPPWDRFSTSRCVANGGCEDDRQDAIKPGVVDGC